MAEQKTQTKSKTRKLSVQSQKDYEKHLSQLALETDAVIKENAKLKEEVRLLGIDKSKDKNEIKKLTDVNVLMKGQLDSDKIEIDLSASQDKINDEVLNIIDTVGVNVSKDEDIKVIEALSKLPYNKVQMITGIITRLRNMERNTQQDKRYEDMNMEMRNNEIKN